MISPRRSPELLSASEAAVLPPGTRVGRYVVSEMLGSGGVAGVYRAYDPQLDRRVALKVFTFERSDTETERTCRRLVREGQALAKLTHPNIVTVYDAGAFDCGVFIAMELVAGCTLDVWWQREGRPRVVLEALVAAGRGLAAAHQAGIVHRDFKPANVMVADTGDVRVLDFGLARAAHASETSSALASSAKDERPLEHATLELPRHHATPEDITVERAPEPSALDLRGIEVQSLVASPSADVLKAPSAFSGLSDLTEQGSLLGTPAYMAPEQLRHQALDARSDQFSFCAVVYEALLKSRPFGGATFAERLAVIETGQVVTPTRMSAVARRARRHILRGLASDPDARFPTMDALLDHLEQGLQGWRRFRAPLMGALGLAAATLVSMPLLLPQGEGRCEQGERLVQAAWSEPLRARLRTAFVASERHHAAATFDRLSATIDRFAQDWTQVYRTSCEATHVRGDQSAHLLDLRTRCLNRRLLGMEALVQRLVSGLTPEIVDRVTPAAVRLADLHDCTDDETLLSRLPPPTDAAQRHAVDRLAAELARLQALIQLAQYDESQTLADQLLEETALVGYRPLQGEAQYQRALLYDHRGAYEQAFKSYQKAAQLGGSVRDAQLIVKVWPRLMWVEGYRLGRTTEALSMARLLEPMVEAAADLRVRALFANIFGVLLSHSGSEETAGAQLATAYALFVQAHGDAHPDVAKALNNLGSNAILSGRLDEAVPFLEQALQISERILGPEHPQVAFPYNNLGYIMHLLGRDALAEAHFRRALTVWEKSVGRENLDYATALNSLGLTVARRGRVAEGEAALNEALGIRERGYPEGHVHLAYSYLNLGEFHLLNRSLEEAERWAQMALDVRRRTHQANHPLVAECLALLGRVYRAQGRVSAANRVLAEAAPLLESAYGAQHPMVRQIHAALPAVSEN